jgi:hypothetical protein
MLRALRIVGVVVAVLVGMAMSAAAQPRADFRGPVFRVEPDRPSDHTRPGFVTGWVYNDGRGVAGLIRMKVEMLDGSGKVLSEHIGWAYGNATPGGRAYFTIPVPPQSPVERRVTVESYVLQAFESP